MCIRDRPYPIRSVVAVFKMLIRILNTLRSRIWDMVLFLFSDYLKMCIRDREGASAPDYPLQKKRHSLEYLRTISHLRPRTNTFQAVFRIRSMAAYAIHQFFQERGFVYVHTPLITASDCEGAGEMFQVTRCV